MIVLCPHCGHPNTVSDRVRNGSQQETFRDCSKKFGVQFRSGEMRDVTK